MTRLRQALLALCCISSLSMSGCATQKGYDYTAFREARPRSILVLPPVNDSPAVEASYSVLSQVTLPLAESGYYVFPVAVADETFRQNGLNNPAEIAAVPLPKLRQIFGADAALYITVKQYGTVFRVIASESVVQADGRLVDLRSGALLWEGTASASSGENGNNGGGGILGLLVTAIVKQMVESSTDASHNVAGITGTRLLAAGRPSGMLYGPRSPNYQKE